MPDMIKNKAYQEWLKFIEENEYQHVKDVIDRWSGVPGMVIDYGEGVIHDHGKYHVTNYGDHFEITIHTPFANTDFLIKIWNRASGSTFEISLWRFSTAYTWRSHQYFELNWIPGHRLELKELSMIRPDSCLDIYHVSDMIATINEVIGMPVTKYNTKLPVELIDYKY